MSHGRRSGGVFGIAGAVMVLALLVLPSAALADPVCPSGLALDAVHSGGTSSGLLTCDDGSGSGLNYAVSQDAAHGLALVSGSGDVTYYPDASYAGPDAFDIDVTDNVGGETPVHVTVNVTNTAPVCQPLDLGSTLHGQATSGFTDCADDDGDGLTYTVSDPPHGTAQADGGYITYTPDPGYSGADSFTYRASDGIAQSAPAAVTVQVTNSAPVCDAGEQELRTGKPIQLVASCYDLDGDPITVQVTNGPQHGTIGSFSTDPNQPTATYTPNAGYVGTDTFTVRASDGSLQSSPATYSLTVTPDHAPVCSQNGTLHTKVGVPAQVFLFCSDQDAQDAQSLTYSIVAASGPAHGTLGPIADSAVTYTPTAGYSGEDGFRVRASDGSLSDEADQHLHVANTPLCSAPPAISVRSGRSAFLSMDCTSPDQPFQIAHQIVTAPTQGTLSPSSGLSTYRTYAAGAGANGADSFSYKGVDDGAQSPVVTQLITTGTGVNHPPSCTPDGFGDQVAYAGRPNPVYPDCTDPDSDPLSFAAGPKPAHGTSSVSNNQLTYVPDAAYTGADDVPFTVTDGHGGSTDSDVPVTVAPPEAPTCTQGPITATVRPGGTVSLSLFCSNPQDDPQTYSTGTAPSKGSLGDFHSSIGFASVDYTANAGATGTDTFTLKTANTVGASAPQQVTITIDPAYNRAPVCSSNFSFNPKRVVKDVATPLDFAQQCSDPDGDPLTFTRASQPQAGGTLTAGPAAALTYTSAPGYTGPDSFTYFATDSRGTTSDTVTLFLNVVASLAPTCTPSPALSLRPAQSRFISFDCADPDNQTVTYKIVDGPAKGTLEPAGDSQDPDRVYTAGPNTGDDSFTYKATSAGGESTVQTQNISISQTANQPPSCFANPGQPLHVVQGRATQLQLAATCYDPDGDPLTFTRSAPDPQHGTATAANGAITYTSVPANYTGPDAIGYTADDGHGGTATQTFSVDVGPAIAPTCDAPTAVSVRPGRELPLFFDCSDSDGADLTYHIVTAPTLGTLSPAGDGPDADRSYTAGGAAGDDAIAYRATSINGTSTTVTQVIHVTPSANEAPDCSANSFSPDKVAAGHARTIDPDCLDADDDPITYTKLTDPGHGTVSDAGGTLVYTPTAGYTGPDSFTYSAADDHGGISAPTTRHVSVVAATPPSCAAPAPISVRPSHGRLIAFNCTDPLGDPLTYVIDTAPTKGTLSGSGAARSYLAGAQAGQDSFTWHAHSPTTGDGAVQTQAIAIDPNADTAPTCPSPFSVTAKPGVQRTIAPACFDDDGDPLSFIKQSDPAHGTLSDAGGVLRYTATAGYTGADAFTYRADDGHGGQSAISTVSVNVSSANTAPTCASGPFAATVPAGVTSTLPPAPCNDADGDTLTIEVVNAPAHGTLGAPQQDGSRTYTPDQGYSGTDSFTFRAFDGTARSSTETVNLTVTPPANQPPSCAPVVRTVAPTVATTLQLSCTDADGDAITSVQVVSGPSHGTLGQISPQRQVDYTPAAGFTGTDSFTYRATAGGLTGAPATVTITVTHAPVCSPVSAKTPVGTAAAITLSCTDADGDPLTLSKATDPAHGTLGAISGGQVTYTPNAGYFGADSFTYRGSDGAATSAPATVSLTVTRAPSCQAVSAKTGVGTPVTVTLACADADGDPVTLQKVSDPAHGTLGAIDQANHRVTYTPAAGFNGTDTFTFRGTDGTAAGAPATATITITRPPTCSAVNASTPAGSAVTVQLSCTDADGDALTLSADPPAHGTLGAVDQATGHVTYTPAAGYRGADAFTYRASDGTTTSAPATVSLDVLDRLPSCQDVTRRTAVDAAVTVPLSCSDPDGDALTLSIQDQPVHGTLGPIAGGQVAYTPAAGYFGTDSFTYKASDGSGSSPAKTVTVTITRPPACTPQSASTPALTAVAVQLSCTDPDGDAVTLSIVDGPAHGTLGAINAGKVTYTPNAGYHGPDAFSYRASDGTATSPAAPVAVTVQSVNPVVSLAADRTSAQAPADIRFTATGSDPDGGAIARYVFSVDGTEVQSGPSTTLDRHFTDAGTHTVTVRAVDDENETATASRTVNITPAPVTNPPGGGGGGGGGTPPDTTPPTVTLSATKQKLKALLGKGLVLKASCSETCTMRIQLVLDKATARKLKLGTKPVVIGSLTAAGGQGARTLQVKLTAKARKALKRAKALKVTVRVAATDAAGNAAAPVSRSVAVKK